MRIVLAGFMGTGKSAVGRLVAERRGIPFIDLDQWIEERAGMPVREIFAQRGEDEFRSIEKRVVRDASNLDDAVIAAGGGAVVDDENRETLADGGVMVCLLARPEVVATRVADGVEDRPLLAGYGDLVARIQELQAERASAYARIRNQVDTSDLGVEAVAAAVERLVEEIEATKEASS
jgi:shikimate kinase